MDENPQRGGGAVYGLTSCLSPHPTPALGPPPTPRLQQRGAPATWAWEQGQAWAAPHCHRAAPPPAPLSALARPGAPPRVRVAAGRRPRLSKPGDRPAGEGLLGTVPQPRPPPRDRPLPLLRPPARPGPAGSGARPPHHGGRGAGADGAQVRTRSSSRWRRPEGGAGLSGQRAGGAERTRPPVIVNSAATRALGLCSLPALSSGL